MVIMKQPRKRDIRKLMSKSICHFPGAKGISTPTILESPLERDFCYHLEFEAKVVKYESQPLGFIYWDPIKEIERQYTPDFEVYFDSSSCYYEIKYEKDLNRNTDFKRLFELIKCEAKSKNKEIFLVTDKIIHKKYQFDNLMLLHRYSHACIEEFFLQQVKLELNLRGDSPIKHLLREGNKSNDLMQIYKLILEHHLSINIDKENISTDSVVSLI